MAAFAEGWELSLNDNEVKAVLAKIGAIDDHHLNGVGADLAGNLLNEVPDSLRCYFDFEAYARDLFSSGYVFHDGYVFTN